MIVLTIREPLPPQPLPPIEQVVVTLTAAEAAAIVRNYPRRGIAATPVIDELSESLRLGGVGEV